MWLPVITYCLFCCSCNYLNISNMIRYLQNIEQQFQTFDRIIINKKWFLFQVRKWLMRHIITYMPNANDSMTCPWIWFKCYHNKHCGWKGRNIHFFKQFAIRKHLRNPNLWNPVTCFESLSRAFLEKINIGCETLCRKVEICNNRQ